MRYNVLKSCAALSCRACVDETTCVAEQYLTLRTGCSRGRTPKVVRPQQRKNPLPYSFSQRSHIGNLRQIRKQGKGRSSKRKENRRLSFLFAPAAGAARSRRPQTANPPAEVQRKTPRPSGANTPAAVRVPRSAGAEKSCRPVRDESLPAVVQHRKTKTPQTPVRGVLFYSISSRTENAASCSVLSSLYSISREYALQMQICAQCVTSPLASHSYTSSS